MVDPLSDATAQAARLASPSAATVAEAKEALRRLGEHGITALEEAAGQDDVRLRARARQFLGELRRDHGLGVLTDVLDGPATDGVLMEGLFAIDEVLGHGLRGAAEGHLERWSRELTRELAGRSTAGDVAEGLRAVLGLRGGLRGAEEDFHHADHVSLGLTATAGVGLPLTLSAIYADVARRTGHEAGLLPFPGHVLLGVGPADSMVIVDPFSRGALVSKEACLARLVALGAPPNPAWLLPADDRSMLLRQVRNLAAALERHGRNGLARTIARIADESG